MKFLFFFFFFGGAGGGFLVLRMGFLDLILIALYFYFNLSFASKLSFDIVFLLDICV